MNRFKKIVFLAFSLFISLIGTSQNSLRANGKVINNERCIEIKLTSEDFGATKEVLSDILEATIVDDCIELKIQYGGCGGNIEFVTDGKIVNTPKPKMNFKLNWTEVATCKEDQQILVTFDLSIYKRLIQENKAVINILGTDIQLKYK